MAFPFHPYKDGRKGGEVTLVREYAHGPDCMMYCLPTGGFDPKKHTTLVDCALAGALLMMGYASRRSGFAAVVPPRPAVVSPSTPD